MSIMMKKANMTYTEVEEVMNYEKRFVGSSRIMVRSVRE